MYFNSYHAPLHEISFHTTLDSKLTPKDVLLTLIYIIKALQKLYLTFCFPFKQPN